eukprot:60135-Rhodomonas_salina.1
MSRNVNHALSSRTSKLVVSPNLVSDACSVWPGYRVSKIVSPSTYTAWRPPKLRKWSCGSGPITTRTRRAMCLGFLNVGRASPEALTMVMYRHANRGTAPATKGCADVGAGRKSDLVLGSVLSLLKLLNASPLDTCVPEGGATSSPFRLPAKWDIIPFGCATMLRDDAAWSTVATWYGSSSGSLMSSCKVVSTVNDMIHAMKWMSSATTK